ncbi:MAG: DEAD/DEAH box helicase [Pseudomonadales bacterium]
MKFTALDLDPQIQRALELCGYSEMTAVQQKAIVPARRGKDVLANAQTGTGKTAAFALPMIQKLLDDDSAVQPGYCRALILAPTRELAAQLQQKVASYAQFTELTIGAVTGGSSLDSQSAKLKRGLDILIATPGRLLEHIVKCNINLAQAETVVLDEADRMLDMGFISDVSSILQRTADKRQTMLFSATLSNAVQQLAEKILHNATQVRAARQNDTVEHVIYPVEEKRKAELFEKLIKAQNWFQVLVFTSTKGQADDLMRQLKKSGIDSGLCHGDKTQGSRKRAIADFKAAKIQVLVATEVAARGLDIEGLEYVVNYNLPYLAEDYVHRIGRTGRAGNKGTAISFVSREEERALANIEKLIGGQVKRIYEKGFEVSNRENLRKSISKKNRAAPSNKASRTKINQHQSPRKRR